MLASPARTLKPLPRKSWDFKVNLKKIVLVGAFLVAAAVAACVTNTRLTHKTTQYSFAEHTYETRYGGTIKLDGPFMLAMRKAHEIMFDYCDGPYKHQRITVDEINFYCVNVRKQYK